LIYFIRDTGTGAIKIGKAVDAVRRLNILQVGCPSPLQLLGVIPGGGKKEAEIHRQFKDSRLRGEWFDGSAVGAAVAALIQKAGRDRESLETVGALFTEDWSLAPLDSRWDHLVGLVRAYVSPKVGFSAGLAWADRRRSSCPGRRYSFQVMPDGDDHPFWWWHLDTNPQFFATPGDSANSFIRAFQFWASHIRDIAPRPWWTDLYQQQMEIASDV
jgi:hypothetical protein